MTKTIQFQRWKALVEYQEKHDILLLQQRLGHKHLSTTYAYLERSRPLIKLLGDPFC
jgi:hypothetical protein